MESFSSKGEKNAQRRKPNIVKRFFLCWMCPIIFTGNKRDLNEGDLIPPRSKYDSTQLGDELERIWLQEVEDASTTGRPVSFGLALRKAYLWSYMPSGLLILLIMVMRSFQPVLFSLLLDYWNAESEMSRDDALVYAGCLILLVFVAAFLQHHVTFMNYQFGMKMRIASCSLMYRKVLRMNSASLGQTTAGKLVNLLSNDVNRFDYAFLYPHYLWVLPLQLALVSYLMYLQTGVAAFVGLFAVIIITVPIQGVLGGLIAKLRLMTAGRTDERIRTMSEIISGIQVIKMYAWEQPFDMAVSTVRKRELSAIQSASFVRNTFISFMMFTERTALFITVLAYSLFGNQVTASVVYPTTQFLSLVQLNLAVSLPMALAFIAEVKISIQRIQEFLVLDERPDITVPLSGPGDKLFDQKLLSKIAYRQSNEGVLNRGYTPSEYKERITTSGDFALELHDVDAKWTVDADVFTLKHISLRIPKGKLCAVIGAVGSGKSSFLQLILKELPTLNGSMSINGTVSYASQESWLFPSTVRENILFGLPFEAKKYRKICRVCSLEKDFEQFPFGDQTLVGERGVSLSGGQRARINLARCVYKEADIYLLDDPLSAVDANVGRQLFDGCISNYLSGCTRILVTHQIHYLKTADFIIVLNEGEVVTMGTFDELVSSATIFSTLLTTLQDENKNDSGITSKVDKKRPSLAFSAVVEASEQHAAQSLGPEDRAKGQLKWAVVSAYWKASQTKLGLFFTFMLFFLSQFVATFIDFWISYWTNQVALYEENLDTIDDEFSLDTQMGMFTTGQYLAIMGSLVGGCIVLVNIRTLMFVRMCARASQTLHNRMFSNMLRAVMRFFDTSSSGRILNRFSKDMGAVDELLPRTMLETIQIFSALLSVLVLNAVALRWTLVPTFMIITLFIVMMYIYLNAAQSIKRLEATTRSPVFGIISSTLDGMDTIRASGAQARLIESFDNCQNVHTSAWNGYLAGGTTFGLSLDCVCVIYVALIITSFLFLDLDGVIPVGNVGLAVTQSMILTSVLQYGARITVDVIGQMTSVERVLEYTNLEEEANLSSGKFTPSSEWPALGKITFNRVFLRYGPNDRPVLKNINITIESGWKVGVVGRTGAGKTSLISALFRFADIDGAIDIDGVNTGDVAKQELRSKISIIPQEPVLFSATVRYNLDPFNNYSDDELWKALQLVDLQDSIPALDFKVTEGGSNFSVGQRQLVCLARAVLRSNKILIMDEATANVDPQKDSFIQQTIRSQFAGCTVLTIAHRLNTVMDSDRVLVMDTGKVAEFDHPYLLLSDPDSHLSKMVRETGDNMAAQLLQVARQSYSQKHNSLTTA